MVSKNTKIGIGLSLLIVIVVMVLFFSKKNTGKEVSTVDTITSHIVSGNYIYIEENGSPLFTGLIMYKDSSESVFFILSLTESGQDVSSVIHIYNSTTKSLYTSSSNSNGNFTISNASLSVFTNSISIIHPYGTIPGQLIGNTGETYTVKFGNGTYADIKYNFGPKTITIEIIYLDSLMFINSNTVISDFNPLSSTPLLVSLNIFGKIYQLPTKLLSKNIGGDRYTLYATVNNLPGVVPEFFNAYKTDGPSEGVEGIRNLTRSKLVFIVYSTVTNSIVYSDTNIIPKLITVDNSKNFVNIETGTPISLSGYLTALDRIIFENEYGHTFLVYKNSSGADRINITYNNYGSTKSSEYNWGPMITLYDPLDYKKAPPCGNGYDEYLYGYKNCYLGDKLVDPSLCGNSGRFIYNKFADICPKYVKSIKIQRYTYNIPDGSVIGFHDRHVHISEVELYDHMGIKIPSNLLTIVASSFEGVDKPTNIMDSDPNTHWHSNIAVNSTGMHFHWIKMTFDKPYPVTRMKITLPTNLPQDRIRGCGIDFLDSNDVPILDTYIIYNSKPSYDFIVGYPAKFIYDSVKKYITVAPE